MTQNADFFMYDFETLSTKPSASILNIAMLCGQFENWFQTSFESGSNHEAVKKAIRICIKDIDGRLTIPAERERLMFSIFEKAIINMRAEIVLYAFEQERQIELGADIEDSVIEFWGKNKAAYKSTYEDVEPKHQIDDFYRLVKAYLVEQNYVDTRKGGTPVWIRAPHFDDPICKNICHAVTGLENCLPYNPFAVRDVRTIVDAAWGKYTDKTGYVDIYLSDGSKFLDSFGFVKHDSIDDICRDTILTFLSLNRLELI